MKTKYPICFLICCLFLFSCRSNFDIEKRKYRPGWFVDGYSHKTIRAETNNSFSPIIQDSSAASPRVVLKDKNIFIPSLRSVSARKITRSISQNPKTQKTIKKIASPIQKYIPAFFPQKKQVLTSDDDESDGHEGLCAVLFTISILLIILAIIFLCMSLFEVALMLSVCGVFFSIIACFAHGGTLFDFDGDYVTVVAIIASILCGLALAGLLTVLIAVISVESPAAGLVMLLVFWLLFKMIEYKLEGH